MGLPEVQEYANMLKKAEKMKELKQKVLGLLLIRMAYPLWQRETSGRGSGRRSGGRRSGTLNAISSF